MASFVSRSGLDAARAAFFEQLCRGHSVLCVGVGDGAALAVLLDRGATQVAGVDIDEDAVAAARARTGGRANLHVGPLREAASLGAPFDVVIVRRGETMVARDLWREVGKLVRPGGWLVAAALAGDRDGAPRGAMRYQALREHLAAYFPHVTMLAQSSFAGAQVIPFGDAEVDPVLDVALAAAPTPELYLAVAGPEALALPYGLVELPDSALEHQAAQPAAAAAPSAAPLAAIDELRAQLADRERRLTAIQEEHAHLSALSATLRERESRLTRIEEERRALVAELERRTGAGGQALADLREQLVTAEHQLAAAQKAALLHAGEMRAAEAVLGERDAFIAELQRDLRTVDEARESSHKSSARADQAETRERAARRRIAELEGTLLRIGGGVMPPGIELSPPLPPDAAAPVAAGAAPSAESVERIAALTRRVAELEAQAAVLQQKAADSERESWSHMKARSEVEAAAAELREDTVRKLKDARKIANLELMRAMEEATKKAVTLKEELLRSERERKEAVAALAAAQRMKEEPAASPEPAAPLPIDSDEPKSS